MESLNYKKAKGAIDDLFSDTSVSPEETLDELENLQVEIEGLIAAIKDDLKED